MCKVSSLLGCTVEAPVQGLNIRASSEKIWMAEGAGEFKAAALKCCGGTQNDVNNSQKGHLFCHKYVVPLCSWD